MAISAELPHHCHFLLALGKHLSWPRDLTEIWDKQFLHLAHLHIHGINVCLTITDNKPWAVSPSHQEKTTCFGLRQTGVLIWLCYCCLPCSEVIFLKLFCLFISHVFTSFACSGLFLLLNGRWCFTWRKTFFGESCRAFRTQFACKKSWR